MGNLQPKSSTDSTIRALVTLLRTIRKMTDGAVACHAATSKTGIQESKDGNPKDT